MENNREHQEMDLLTLLRKLFDFLYRILKKVAHFFGHLLQLTFKYKYIFFTIVAITAAYAYYCVETGKTYEARLILELNDGDSDFYSGTITSLNHYFEDEDPVGIASTLQLPDKYVGKLAYIGSSFSINPIDSVLSRAEISLILTDRQTFPVIKKAFVDYFKRNEYLKSLNAQRLAFLETTNSLIEKDIAEIDSLSQIEYFQKKNNEATLSEGLVLKTGKQLFYSDKLILLEQKDKVTKELAVKSEILTILSEFEPTKKPMTTFLKLSVKHGIISLISFLLLALLWDNRKCIINYLRGE